MDLFTSSSRGHLNDVKFLFANGTDIHAKKDTALQLASTNGHLDVVKFLLENGADVLLY
jgi:ankyrin repeat protein